MLQRVKEILEVVSTVAVIAGVGLVCWTLYQRQGAVSANAGPPPVEDARATLGAEFVRHVSGSGPLAIVEFTDFQCPFCARHATETVPELLKQLAGRARYVVVNLPLPIHAQAIPAAEAAECAAEQGQYWSMHDALFARQSELATADLRTVAAGLQLDTAAFAACLKADTALARVTADTALADRLGVRSTPTVFVGRMRSDGGVDLLKQVHGARPVGTFVAEVTKLAQR